MISTKIIIFLIAATVAKHHLRRHPEAHHLGLEDLLKYKKNFFSELNESARNVVNRIFTMLNLTHRFAEEPKIKLLLTMHYDLDKIAEKNFDVYGVLRNVSAVDINNAAINKIRLDEYVMEIINEFNVDKKINNTNDKNVQKALTSKAPTLGFNDSKEFKQFIGRFIRKIKFLTVDDLLKESTNKLLSSSRRNLEVWEEPTSNEADSFNDTEYRRVFGGKRTTIVKYPFVVSVHILGEFTCAGSIISLDLILTAASCLQLHYNNRFFRENPRTTYVRVGSDWLSRLGELVPIIEIYFHPMYDPKTLNNNLAVMRLQRSLKFGTRYKYKIKRILLDRRSGNLPTNTNEIRILGWGARKPNQVVNKFEKLTVAVLDIYQIDECKEIYSKVYVTSNNFCAGFVSKGGGACNRDVGAPGLVGSRIAGVVSFGAPVCGAIDAPTVFTRVGSYKHWIDHIISLVPPRYGVRTTSKPKKLLQINYNPVSTRTNPRMKPITVDLPTGVPLRMRTPPKSFDTLRYLRAREEPGETDVLGEIDNDMAEKDEYMIHDIINEDLYKDFHDILTPIEKPKVERHPLINKTLFLIPGVHYDVGDKGVTTYTTRVTMPTFLMRTTPEEFASNWHLRADSKTESEEYNKYDVYNADNDPETEKQSE